MSLKNKTLYMFVGTMKLTKDKFEELLEDFIQNQQYTEDEGRRITLDFLHKMDVLKKDIDRQISMKSDEIKAEMKSYFQQRVDQALLMVKKKVQDYSIEQLLSGNDK
ncbi:MAG: hypothetical protein M9887_10315 [Chitinophagales bacterium]|nr:hypothetical protein [Chitinophagales bacterium]